MLDAKTLWFKYIIDVGFFDGEHDDEVIDIGAVAEDGEMIATINQILKLHQSLN